MSIVVFAFGIYASSALAMLIAPAEAQAQEPTAVFTMDAAVATALKDKPSIRGLRLARQVAEADIRVAGQRPNPDVVYETARETPHDALTLVVPDRAWGQTE